MIELKKTTHHIDAGGESLGRLATKIARLLMGKNKPSYSPHKDGGDTVVVTNVDRLAIAPKKVQQKKYYHYSGYPGGMKSKKMSNVLVEEPAEVLRHAVYYMLPKNKLRKNMIKRLIIAKAK
jgi:large subunit ribosomal protein L13